MPAFWEKTQKARIDPLSPREIQSAKFNLPLGASSWWVLICNKHMQTFTLPSLWATWDWQPCVVPSVGSCRWVTGGHAVLGAGVFSLVPHWLFPCHLLWDCFGWSRLSPREDFSSICKNQSRPLGGSWPLSLWSNYENPTCSFFPLWIENRIWGCSHRPVINNLKWEPW